MSLERKGAIAITVFFISMCVALDFEAAMLVQLIGYIGFIVSFVYGLKVFKEYERIYPNDINQHCGFS